VWEGILMNKKQIIILSIILGLLALGILLKSWVRSAGDARNSVSQNGSGITKFDPIKIEKILIGRGVKAPPVELVKENGIWRVKGLWNVEADPTKVEALIRKLGSANLEMRGTGKKFFPDFGIQNGEAFSIKFFDAGNIMLLDLLLGTKQAGPEGYFVRGASKEDIYFIELNMSELLGIYTAFEEAVPLANSWADFRLFELEPEKVTKITASSIKGDERTLVLGLMTEADPKDPLKRSWKFLRKDMKLSLDPEKVLKFIVMLQSLRAQKVMDPAGKGYGLEKPAWQLAVTEGNKKTILNVGTKETKGDLYYVKTSQNPAVLGLSAHFFDDLNVDDTHFVKGASPAAGSETAVQNSDGQTL